MESLYFLKIVRHGNDLQPRHNTLRYLEVLANFPLAISVTKRNY